VRESVKLLFVLKSSSMFYCGGTSVSYGSDVTMIMHNPHLYSLEALRGSRFSGRSDQQIK
jgi:hypothetical protein